MKYFVFVLLFLSLSHIVNAQGNTISFRPSQQTADNAVTRSVDDRGTQGISVSYRFNGMEYATKTEKGTPYQYLHIRDFTYLKNTGKPALPVHYDLVLIPEGSRAEIRVKEGAVMNLSPWLVYPALRMATDREGDPEPEFEIDEAFYSGNQLYPEQSVRISGSILVKGLEMAIIEVCPVRYMPSARTLYVYPDLQYEVVFTPAESFIREDHFSARFLEQLPNFVLNNASLKKELSSKTASKAVSGPAVDYIIVTHDNYLAAADSLAQWKAQLGYSCEIVSASSWTSATVKQAIQQRYQNWNPKPDYFVILGDHNLVPGEIHQDPSYGDDFATDLYYACMDGGSDYVADMAFGRISVSSATEAMNVVRKIINYERNPPSTAAFYTSGLNCAQFQDDDSNSYEDRRFSLTSEDIRTYLVNQHGFSINRVYKTDSDITPLYWNDGYYAAGEPVPANLRKPTFAWDGDKYDIRDEINSASGRLFVLHRDHGYVGGSGWATPQFVTSDINMLNNGNRTPVVFSINCHTGEYQLTECFSEKFLRYNNGGAVGVFGAAYYSYSGYNDGLVIGMFDAIWANPGLIPNFTGNGDYPSGSPSPHAPIYTMGDVMNQGLIRMIQTWGDDDYTHELFHYFGDPAMRMWTGQPSAVTATHSDSLHCADSVFYVYSSSLSDGLATLVVDGELIAETTLSSGSGMLTFPPFGGSVAILTISKHNFQPYIAYIPVDPDCVKADFDLAHGGLCVGENLTVTSTSTGSIASYLWDFGTGAVPATATTAGPHTFHYTTAGQKTITLTVTGSSGSSTYSTHVNIEQICSFNMISGQEVSFSACNGVLFDHGGTSSYLNNSADTAYVSAPGATSIQLIFHDFDVEAGSGSLCNYDYLSIYDGPSTASPLIGTYCNTPGHTPPPTLQTTGSTFTITFFSDGGVTGSGYEIEWACTTPNSPPNANFNANPLYTCQGEVQFSDLSLNTPASWLWDFGDGQTSGLQNPLHTYTQNGIYTVSLTASNIYGSDLYTRIQYIEINMPEAPVTDTGMICVSGSTSLNASGNGDIYWYDQPVGGNLLGTGNTFVTPGISTTTTYYAEDQTEDLYFTLPSDSALGSGGYYTGGTSHYMIFNALTDFTLKSVLVYASVTQDRTIELRNASGVLLYDTLVSIPAGESRVVLNFPVSTGNAYRLVAGPTNRLYRNIAGASYPYTIPGVISITGNSYNNPNYYYYFYEWEILGSSCKSPRTAAPVFVHSNPPQADFTWSVFLSTYDFIDLSQDAVTWNWDFGDGYASSLQTPSHTYTANGTYYVNLTAGNACGTATHTDTLYLVAVGVEEAGTIISLHPNPTGGLLVIGTGGINGKITLQLFDIAGRCVMTETRHIDADSELSLNLGSLTEGLYLLKITHREYTWQNKILKF